MLQLGGVQLVQFVTILKKHPSGVQFVQFVTEMASDLGSAARSGRKREREGTRERAQERGHTHTNTQEFYLSLLSLSVSSSTPPPILSLSLPLCLFPLLPLLPSSEHGPTDRARQRHANTHTHDTHSPQPETLLPPPQHTQLLPGTQRRIISGAYV